MASKYYDSATCATQVHNSGHFRFITEPLGDCQTFSIYNMQELLRKEDRLILLKEIYKNIIGKKQLLCNVKQGGDYHFGEQLEEMCKSTNSIIWKQEYISTNESHMTMYLINVQKLTENINI